jgi:hypothetical protein
MVLTGKGFGRKRSWPDLRYYAGVSLEGLSKTKNSVSQHWRSPGPVFESGTSRKRSRSVNHFTTTFDDISTVFLRSKNKLPDMCVCVPYHPTFKLLG